MGKGCNCWSCRMARSRDEIDRAGVKLGGRLEATPPGRGFDVVGPQNLEEALADLGAFGVYFERINYEDVYADNRLEPGLDRVLKAKETLEKGGVDPRFLGAADVQPPKGPIPENDHARKLVPLASGLFDFFPDALAAVATASQIAAIQHGQDGPLRWDRKASPGDGDALLRHFAERGVVDTDGVRHSAKVAWRALAILQRELDALK